jgi:hypothetical protein
VSSLAESVTWALVFSLPVGVGIALATSRVSGARLTAPLVLGSGLLFAVTLFAITLVAFTRNQGE